MQFCHQKHIPFALYLLILLWLFVPNRGWAQVAISSPEQLKPWVPYVEKKSPDRWCPELSASNAVEKVCVTGSGLSVIQKNQKVTLEFHIKNESLQDSWVRLPALAVPYDIEQMLVDGLLAFPKKNVDGSGVYFLWRMPAGKTHKISLQLILREQNIEPLEVVSPPYIPWVKIIAEGTDLTKRAKEEIDIKNGSLGLALLPKVKVYRKFKDGAVPLLESFFEIENASSKVQTLTLHMKNKEQSKKVSVEILRGALDVSEQSAEDYVLSVPSGVSWMKFTQAVMIAPVDKKLTLDFPYRVGGGAIVSQEIWVVEKQPSFRDLRASQSAPVDTQRLPDTLSAFGLPAFEVNGSSLVLDILPQSQERKNSEFRGFSNIWLNMEGSELLYSQVIRGEETRGNAYPSVTGWDITQLRIQERAGSVFEKEGNSVVWLPAGSDFFEILAVKPLESSFKVIVPTQILQSMDFKNEEMMKFNLPPAWRSFLVTGGDSAQALLNRLSLWDWFIWFLILWSLVALLKWPLGIAIGVGVFLGLLQAHHIFKEWLWLLLLVGLIPKIPEGKFKRFSLRFFYLSAIVLLIGVGNFTYQSVQMILYPSLQYHCPGCHQRMSKAEESVALATIRAPVAQDLAAGSISEKAIPMVQSKVLKEQPSPVIENGSLVGVRVAGRGEPKWSFGGVEIKVSAHSKKDIEVYLVPFGLNAFFSLFSVASYILLLYSLVRVLRTAKAGDGDDLQNKMVKNSGEEA